MSSVRRELTDDDKKLIINLNNNNYTQEFFASTLNVSQSCISKFGVGRCSLSVHQVYTENSVVRSLLLVPQGRKIASIFCLSETYI